MGKAGTGKDTIASYIKNIIENEEKQFVCKFAFADPIKHIAANMFPNITTQQLWGPSKFRGEIVKGAIAGKYWSEKHYRGRLTVRRLSQKLTIRRLLQDIGTIGREYDPKCWIKCLDYRIKLRLHGSSVIITDARQKNEYDYLKRNNYFIINVVRKTKKNKQTESHITEFGQEKITDFDYVIDNNISLSKLKKLIENKVMPEIQKHQHKKRKRNNLAL